MSSYVGVMQQDASGLRVDVYEGWSWPCFFFGPFWYLVKGMWGIGLLWLALAVVSVSGLWFVGMIIMPFLANRQYREHLGSRGYRNAVPLSVEVPAHG